MKATRRQITRIKNREKYLRSKIEKFEIDLPAAEMKNPITLTRGNTLSEKLKQAAFKKFSRVKKIKTLTVKHWRSLDTLTEKFIIEAEVTYLM